MFESAKKCGGARTLGLYLKPAAPPDLSGCWWPLPRAVTGEASFTSPFTHLTRLVL